MKKISRRNFMTTQIKAFFAFGVAQSIFVQDLIASTLKYQNQSCGKKSNQKILIVYDSGFGSTKEISEYIGKNLCNKGIQVDIKWIENLENFHGYDGYIFGSPIQYDKWKESMITFLDKHQENFINKPIAYFFTCLTLSRDNEESKQQAIEYENRLSKMFNTITPLSIGSFAGVLDYTKISFPQKAFAKVIFFALKVKEGDFRNWNQIKKWTDEIYVKFTLRKETI